MRFILDDAGDIIQKALLEGKFYEQEELDVMQKHCPKDAVIFDIGANVGNHTVYFAKFFDAKTVYAFEPIPRSYKMLLCNVALNYCHNVNVDFIGLALGHVNRQGYPYMKYARNLGSVSIAPMPIESEFDPVEVVRGDDLVKDIHVDFMKIDVEGMEMVVLLGLEETIKRDRPNIYIEVDAQNKEEFLEWCDTNQYAEVWSNSWEDMNFNYMLLPKEKLTT